MAAFFSFQDLLCRMLQLFCLPNREEDIYYFLLFGPQLREHFALKPKGSCASLFAFSVGSKRVDRHSKEGE